MPALIDNYSYKVCTLDKGCYYIYIHLNLRQNVYLDVLNLSYICSPPLPILTSMSRHTACPLSNLLHTIHQLKSSTLNRNLQRLNQSHSQMTHRYTRGGNSSCPSSNQPTHKSCDPCSYSCYGCHRMTCACYG